MVVSPKSLYHFCPHKCYRRLLPFHVTDRDRPLVCVIANRYGIVSTWCHINLQRKWCKSPGFKLNLKKTHWLLFWIWCTWFLIQAMCSLIWRFHFKPFFDTADAQNVFHLASSIWKNLNTIIVLNLVLLVCWTLVFKQTDESGRECSTCSITTSPEIPIEPQRS